MATTKVISGNPIHNNGGSIVKAGTQPTGSKTNSVGFAVLNSGEHQVNKVYQAVSPISSGNIGTSTILSARRFGKQEKGQYIAMIIGNKIANVADTSMQGGASDQVRKPIQFTESTRAINITSWDYVTGAATYGANRGSGVSFGTDKASHPSGAVPGRLVYSLGGTPTQLSYKPRG